VFGICDNGKVLVNIAGITDITTVVNQEYATMNLVFCHNVVSYQLPFCQSLMFSVGPKHLLFVQ
jgi:hypothetical protein